ncbi:hypothetical protein NFI96_027130 [Prochilodus magdalenae]|nr:hypothetical protein NFI96_027130 [Prochilodus magdalenae]
MRCIYLLSLLVINFTDCETMGPSNDKKHKSVFKPRSPAGPRSHPHLLHLQPGRQAIAAGCQYGTTQIWEQKLQCHVLQLLSVFREIAQHPSHPLGAEVATITASAELKLPHGLYLVVQWSECKSSSSPFSQAFLGSAVSSSLTLSAIFSLSLSLSVGVLAQLQLPQTNVDVIQGQMAVLQAYYTSEISQSATVMWNAIDQPEMVISYTNAHVVQGPTFTDRVGFVRQMPNNNLSIYINNTLESDSGKYMCQVVQDGSSTMQLTLNVRVPPAPPVCTLQGKPVLKANVTLSCHSATGKPAPKYKWAKTSPSPEVFFSPMLNETGGTLKLNNLSSNMSGKYECTSSNSAGEGKCYINLEVITATNAGVIAGATVGAVVGFVLIVVFILFLWTRKKDAEEDLANDIKEDAQAPKRVSWAKSGTGSDIISKNGTLSSINSSPNPRDTHNHYQHHYPHPTSDTASIITATGSTAGFRPRPVANMATPERTLPGYNTDPTLPRHLPGPPSSNGGSLPRTEAAQPQMPHPPPLPTGVSIANISRMGGVPIMVPAQNQAGSLV